MRRAKSGTSVSGIVLWIWRHRAYRVYLGAAWFMVLRLSRPDRNSVHTFARTELRQPQLRVSARHMAAIRASRLTLLAHALTTSRLQQWAPALAMIAVFALFFAELFAFRIGTQRLERIQAAKYGTFMFFDVSRPGDADSLAMQMHMGTTSASMARSARTAQRWRRPQSPLQNRSRLHQSRVSTCVPRRLGNPQLR